MCSSLKIFVCSLSRIFKTSNQKTFLWSKCSLNRDLDLSNPTSIISSRVFVNGPGEWGSIPGRIIPKTFKMVLDTSLFNTQHYKVRIEGKVEQTRERSSALPTPRCSSYGKGSLQVALTFTTHHSFTVV